jgi:hypothetical protein
MRLSGFNFWFGHSIIRKSMADDELIDLLKAPDNPKSDSGESSLEPDRDAAFDPKLLASWNPTRRDYPNVLLITFAGLALILIVVGILKDRPSGPQVAAMVLYTFAIPYILSDRFLRFVPWALLNRFRKKFLLMHCLALAVIYGITTFAFSVKSSLPDLFITSGRRPSLFYYCLGGILLALAFWECSWISKHKGRDTSGEEQN